MIKGSLFTRYFLEDGIRETEPYKSLSDAALNNFANLARARWVKLAAMNPVSEAETESEFIYPLFTTLGWHHLPQQKTGKDRKDIPDALLFLSDAIKTKALPLPPAKRYDHGTVVVENEARDTRLGSGSETKETPAGQILRYLSRADIASSGALRWGLLTNGRLWRLYDQRALSRAEGFVEFDLAALLSEDLPREENSHWLRVFLLIFRVESFVPEGVANRSFIQFVLAEGKKYEQRITADLSSIVFNEVYPGLIAAIGNAATPDQTSNAAWRAGAREAGLKLLFRLLFLLYAEDRLLLPTSHPGYHPYSLRTLREEAEKIADNRLVLSPKQKTWWQNLTTLFKAIAEGDDAMGLPPYNGGLFNDESGAGLSISLPDGALAPLIDKMSREGAPGARRWINYRDLSVQQLGSIYERLLEQDVIAAPSGGLTLRPNAFSRKTTGSYYTPDELVQLILRRAIGPLLKERSDTFVEKAKELAKDKRPKAERLKALRAYDSATAFITLRIIDPAMGSGHFLVSLVDFLADQVLAAMADAPGLVPWAGEDMPYRSPLADQILQLRTVLQTRALNAGWPVRDDQLDDRHLIRRIILKRVIYGVDLNPMAVELAKLSLWLHSFTVGAPLSFLDHHLRVGDSLFGEFVAPVQAELRERYGFVMTDAVTKAANAAAGMGMVEALSDADITEVKQSASGFAGVEEATAELRAFLDVYHAARWLPGETLAQQSAIATFFGGGYGDPVAISAGAKPKIAKDGFGAKKGKKIASALEIHDAAIKFFADATTLNKAHRFLHWEAAFPGVWEKWETAVPVGGFDAVIGNPPWDRMKLQEAEWFKSRFPEIARTERATDRDDLIRSIKLANPAFAEDYKNASWTANTAMTVARKCGAYPLLSSGDINLYSLFVERASRLIRPNGIVGLLVPSGVSADLNAAEFFRSISTSGKLASLLDFENRRSRHNLPHFFPDVDSRFKFSVIVFCGSSRRFEEAKCAFFQQAADEAETNAFALFPADFAAVNPNTGTAPIFRNQRDAQLTRKIYVSKPILVDRRESKIQPIWPVNYANMFHMANDSNKFYTSSKLEKLKAYRVKSGWWEKGDNRFIPLYEGKMVQAYDHRAASVEMKSGNRYREAMAAPTSEDNHKDPSWVNTPQFWINEAELSLRDNLTFVLVFKDITSSTNRRSVIATFIPKGAAGHTLPALLPAANCSVADYASDAPILLGMFNSIPFDYFARQKIQTNHLTWYLVEQLVSVSKSDLNQKFGGKTAGDIIREDVLHLTYVSYDMAGFAESQGYSGPPFAWDEEDRLRRRARLDALFFHLYGIAPEDIKYILSTFPIVIREEVQKYGSFRSEKLILGYYNALAAGNPYADIAG